MMLRSLTTREREVMTLVVADRMNKIGAELNVSEVTAKVHRGQVTRMMQARSPAEFVRMADKLGTFRAKGIGSLP